MFVIILGFRSHERRAIPVPVYIGNCGDEAARAVEATRGKGFVRLGKLVEPSLIPVAIPQDPPKVQKPKEEKPKEPAKADEKAAKAAAKASAKAAKETAKPATENLNKNENA